MSNFQTRTVLKNMKSKKAFTLIEILVAVAIFSTAMIIATGIFSNVIGSQSLVTASSTVNNEAQRILRQISDDTVNAIGTGTTNIPAGTAGSDIQAKGILFLKDDGSIASAADIPTGVVLFSSAGLKIYRIKNNNIEYTADTTSNKLRFNSLASPPKVDERPSGYNFLRLNSSNVEISTLNLSGFFCYNSSCLQAPYLKIDMTIQTKNYSSQAARHRAKIQLRTMVTGRSY